MVSLDEFNGFASAEAEWTLLDCCSSRRWARTVIGGRPYASLAALLDASDLAVARLSEADLVAALAGHPRIGDRHPGGQARARAQAQAQAHAQAQARAQAQAPAVAERDQSSPVSSAWSSQEQAGVDRADAELRRALAEGNARYEAAFGHIYLACATGKSAAELLAFLRERLDNDHETEWGVVASELAKINQIRLRKLIGDS